MYFKRSSFIAVICWAILSKYAPDAYWFVLTEILLIRFGGSYGEGIGAMMILFIPSHVVVSDSRWIASGVEINWLIIW